MLSKIQNPQHLGKITGFLNIVKDCLLLKLTMFGKITGLMDWSSLISQGLQALTLKISLFMLTGPLIWFISIVQTYP